MVFADDEHGVALVVTTASRDGRRIKINDAHIFRLREGKVVASGTPRAHPRI